MGLCRSVLTGCLLVCAVVLPSSARAQSDASDLRRQDVLPERVQGKRPGVIDGLRQRLSTMGSSSSSAAESAPTAAPAVIRPATAPQTAQQADQVRERGRDLLRKLREMQPPRKSLQVSAPSSTAGDAPVPTVVPGSNNGLMPVETGIAAARSPRVVLVEEGTADSASLSSAPVGDRPYSAWSAVPDGPLPNQVPAASVSHSRPVASEATPLIVPAVPESFVPGTPLPRTADQPVIPDPHLPAEAGVSYAEGFAGRTAACTSNQCDPSMTGWWHAQSVNYQMNNRRTAVRTAQAASHAASVVHTHISPEQPDGEVDVYETKSRITVTSVVDETASGQMSATSKRLKTRPISEIQPTLDFAFGKYEDSYLPDGFFDRMENGEYERPAPSSVVYQWAPTNLYHYPLYFEDPALERYGHTYHPLIQPFASTGRFYTQLIGLPYQMSLKSVRAREYTLGWYRPGEWAPKKKYQIPFHQDALTAQVAGMAALFLIIP